MANIEEQKNDAKLGEQVAAHGGAVDVVNLGDVDHIGAAIAGCR